ncbi:hypothetical protein PG993_005319 [Apiospora rasikravindrae]|uniref:Tyrosinase copper-binding domain-containing protein n=1 Tax=Apiospora rasikravindrae TaxID=990691 RepID=A0ABR1TF87_9PEZI
MRFSLAAQALCGASIALAAPTTLALDGMDGLKDLQNQIESGIKHIVEELARPLQLHETPGAHTISLADFKNMDLNGTVAHGSHGGHENHDKAQHDAISKVSQAKVAHQPPFQSKFASPQKAQSCASNPNVRFEWRDYSGSDRKALVDGIKCLMNKPPSGKFEPATNRYEDLVRVHQNFAPNIHNNNKFLLWHRYFLWTFEQMLREECNFDRAFVFWDEKKDAGHFAEFDMFSPDYFGSLPGPTDGAGTCIKDGAFANTTLHVGPGTGNSPHCLSRAVDETATANCDQNFEDYCLSKETYPEFESCWEYGPHGYGHNGIGSVMGDVLGSVGDPAFWMHHSYIDRVFRVWQNVDEKRRTTISGTIGDGSPLTLDTPVIMGGIRPDAKVGDVLDTLNGVMCYKYQY